MTKNSDNPKPPLKLGYIACTENCWQRGLGSTQFRLRFSKPTDAKNMKIQKKSLTFWDKRSYNKEQILEISAITSRSTTEN